MAFLLVCGTSIVYDVVLRARVTVETLRRVILRLFSDRIPLRLLLHRDRIFSARFILDSGRDRPELGNVPSLAKLSGESDHCQRLGTREDENFEDWEIKRGKPLLFFSRI